MPHVDPHALHAALDKLNAAAVSDLDGVLHNVVESVTNLFAVDGAGLMFLDDTDALRYVAASDPASETLEKAQEELGRGPCVDSLVLGAPIASTDLEADDRWAGLAERVVPAGVRAVLGVPVSLGGGSVGSLNAYCGAVHDWDDSELVALAEFAVVVEALLGAPLLAHQRGRIVEQLEYALEHRVVIERAIGLVMGRRGDVDAVAAFNWMRSLARQERRRVAEVASGLLAGTIAID